MSLKEQLDNFKEIGFSQMPIEVAKILLDGIEEVIQSNIAETSLKKGDKIPDFNLPDIHGNNLNIKKLINKEFLIINFYRGGWCPYCNMELQEYERLKDTLESAGASIVAISPEKSKYILSTSDKNALTFNILSDENTIVMKQFGIVYQLNEEMKNIYRDFGIDLTKNNGNSNFELPIPATYIINKNMEILFAHVEADYTTRFEPSQLLKILKQQK